MSTPLKFPPTVRLAPQDFLTEERKGERVTRWKRSPTLIALKPSKVNGAPDHFDEAVVHGRRRLLVDSAASVVFTLANPSHIHTLRVRVERAARDKGGRAVPGRWERLQADGFVPPGASLSVAVGGGQRAVIEEMPS